VLIIDTTSEDVNSIDCGGPDGVLGPTERFRRRGAGALPAALAAMMIATTTATKIKAMTSTMITLS
jgi:hypothetical protein